MWVRQSTRAVIPSIITQALNNQNIQLKYRNYRTTYVSDLCNAYLEILKIKNFYGEPINCGNKKELKIKDIAKLIIKIINPKLKIITEKKG